MLSQKSHKLVLVLMMIVALLITACAPSPVYAGAESGGVTGSRPATKPDSPARPLPALPALTVRAWGQQDPEALRGKIFPERTVTLPATPVDLVIPVLNVDAPVESVGRTADGAMDVPSRTQTTAWYRLGAAPGQEGTAVIAGHLDTARGKPAVFWDLAKLRPGDEVAVTDSDGITHTFAVDRVARYAYDDAPLDEIFGFQPGAHLNLITCAGSWNDTDDNYSQRLVVYTTLVTE